MLLRAGDWVALLAWAALAVVAGCASGGAPPTGTDAGGDPRDAGGGLDAGADEDAGVAPDAAPPCEGAADCDDGDACNGLETCVDGACAPGLSVDCDDGVACTTDACDPASASCSHTPDDAACSSGMVCDPIDGCETPLACEGDAECDDGRFCNGVETCDPAIGCRPGTPPSCDDGIACTMDACSAASDACTSVPMDAMCGDGLRCNGTERCDVAARGCAPGIAVTCNDGIACTIDACTEPSGLCTYTAPDADGDGYAAAGCGTGDDCNDLAPAVHPGAPEICNGVDDDCVGGVDNGPGMECALGSPPAACTTMCGTAGTQGCTSSCTRTPCRAAAETCGNGCDDDGNGLVDDGCAPPAPVNDLCAGAITLSGSGTRSDTLVGATAQASDCGTGVEVFYRVTVTTTSVVWLSTLGGATWDTRLSYRGTGCPGTSAQCVDDSCGTLQTQLAQVVPPGTHYFAVHTYSSFTTPGAFTLQYAIVQAAAGDNVLLTLGGAGTTSVQTGTTAGGAGAVGGTCGGGSAPEDAFYWLQCPSDARSYGVSMCTGTSYDVLVYYRHNGTQIACNDDSCGLQSVITGAAASGAGVVQLFIDGYSTASGAYTATITF